jgi:hypothetical protein
MSVSLALPDFINWDYVEEQIRRYNAKASDDLLYRIGTHVDALTPADQEAIQIDQGFTPEQRFRVLDWIVSCQNTVELDCDLALLIFGREQLTQWLKKSRQAYPNYNFYLPFEYLTRFQSGCSDGICFSMYWRPGIGAPVPNIEMDFPWKLYWESGEMFWGDWMPNGNQFDFILNCYPSQESFSSYYARCEKGDRYTTLTPEEASLMSVAQVLERFS